MIKIILGNLPLFQMNDKKNVFTYIVLVHIPRWKNNPSGSLGIPISFVSLYMRNIKIIPRAFYTLGTSFYRRNEIARMSRIGPKINNQANGLPKLMDQPTPKRFSTKMLGSSLLI